jgi:hypothetical protein
MRQSGLLVLALFLAPAAGCFTAEPERSLARLGIQGPFTGPQGDDVVQLDVALIECSVGDSYINKHLWQLADESVSPDLKPILQTNGFRACQTGCTPPPGLLDLLKSEKYNVNPRHVCTRANSPTTIFLGPEWTTCPYDLDKNGLPIPVEIQQAQCALTVVPVLTDDGRVTLRFTPEVRHGATVLKPKPLQEPSGAKSWTLAPEQPTEAYAWLGWEMTVKPGEFVAVGTLLNRPDTLGFRCFLYTETCAPVQRLLVIRPARPSCEHAPAGLFNDRAPPLAVQAGGYSH